MEGIDFLCKVRRDFFPDRVLLLVIYSLFWVKKANGGVFVLYGLAFVPAVLFLLNGILLRHPALVATSLVFGVFHFLIVKENI